MRLRRRAISSVRLVGLSPRAMSYWCWSAAGRAARKKPVVTALVLPGWAPGLRFGGRVAVGLLLGGYGLEAGDDEAECGGFELVGCQGDG